jgi:hypothetical protein
MRACFSPVHIVKIDVLKEHHISFSNAGNLGKTAAVIYKMLQQAPGDTSSPRQWSGVPVLVTFKLNSDVCNISTRQKYNFHQPSSNVSLYQKCKC